MAKTLRKPVDRFERKQKLAQRFVREEEDFDARSYLLDRAEVDAEEDVDNDELEANLRMACNPHYRRNPL